MFNAILRYSVSNAIVAIPLALVVGRGMLTPIGVGVFAVLSLVMPLLLRRAAIFKGVFEFPWHGGIYAYCWFFWNVFFLFGTVLVPINLDLSNRLLVSFVWMGVLLLLLLLMILSSVALTMLMRRTRHGFWDELLDVSIFSLPVPLLMIGDIFYQDLQDPFVAANLSRNVLALVGIIVYLMIIMVMATLVFYYYPRHGEPKWPRIARIVVTAFIWVVINMLVLNSSVSDNTLSFYFLVLPVFEGNPLVYITPAVFELLVFSLAILAGKGIEKLLSKKAV